MWEGRKCVEGGVYPESSISGRLSLEASAQLRKGGVRALQEDVSRRSSVVFLNAMGAGLRRPLG